MGALQSIRAAHSHQFASIGDKFHAHGVRKQAFILGSEANVATNVELLAAKILAQNLAGSFVDGNEAQERANHCRLARTIGSKQPDCARRNRQ
jgi:hypothetical protein